MNVWIGIATVALVLVALFAAGVFKSSDTVSLSLQTPTTLNVQLLPADKVLLASRTVLLTDDQMPLNVRDVTLPSVVNLWTRAGASRIEVDDQGQFGSCTAHAMRYAWRLWRNRMNPGSVPSAPSRMFWYAESRLRIGEKLNADRGSTNAATVWALAVKGFVPEASWPYTRENLLRAPLPLTRQAALAGRCNVPSMFRFFSTPANTVQALRTALSQGKSVILAVLVFSSFMSAETLRTGRIPFPNRTRERLLGGHAITLTGFDFPRAVFTFRNSWGTGVGVQGQFEIPFSYVANPSLAGDAWIF